MGFFEPSGVHTHNEYASCGKIRMSCHVNRSVTLKKYSVNKVQREG